MSSANSQPRRRQRFLEQFHGADHLAAGIMDGPGPHMHRQAVALAMPEEDRTRARPGISQHVQQRAAGAAQHASFRIAVHEQIAMAELPGHLVRQVTADPLGAPVPIQDSAVAIDDVDAGVELIEQRLEQLAVAQRL